MFGNLQSKERTHGTAHDFRVGDINRSGSQQNTMNTKPGAGSEQRSHVPGITQAIAGDQKCITAGSLSGVSKARRGATGPGRGLPAR